MKRNRRILSLLLAICLIAALIPATVFAEGVSTSEAVRDDQIVTFAGKDWIVLDSTSSELVLILKTPEAPIAYNASGLSNAWSSSDAKAWCESEEVRGWFSDAEWSALNEDKVFFLSHEEAVTYFQNNSNDTLRTDNGWWLRHEGEGGDSKFGVAVSDAGFVGMPHVATNYGARPAIVLDVNKIALMVQNGTKWEPKIIDEGAFSAFAAQAAVTAENTATVTYSGAIAGSIYVILTDRVGTTLTYKVETVSSASGSITIDLPEKLVGWHTVKVFNIVGNVSSPVKFADFAIADDHGNVTEWNVNLGGDISANFNIELDDEIKEDAGAKVTVTHNGVVKEVTIDEMMGGTTTAGNTYVSLPVNLHAPQMNDAITIQIVDGKGNPGGEQTFTIREYAETIINGNYAPKAKTLVKHMLNYGAAAQSYFNYNTDDLANKNIGDVEQNEVPNEGKSVVKGDAEGIEYYGASLVLNSQTTLRFYFTIAEGKEISDFAFDGDPVVHSRVVGGEKLYFIDITGIAPDMLGEIFSISVGGKLVASYRPIDYIMNQANKSTGNFKALMTALYNYYEAAVDYIAD